MLLAQARKTLLQDAILRDITTARRAALLELLWNERFLTREQLITRIGWKLGMGCFGHSAWQDNFYRDIRVVKQAFRESGFTLEYHRGANLKGYSLKGQPALSTELKQIIQSSSSEVDSGQIEIYRALSPAEKFRQGSSTSNTARRAVAYRIQQENPDIPPEEANRLALQRSYQA